MDVTSAQWGKSAPARGLTPAIALINPRYPHNVGAAVRAASCFGVKQVWFTGNRVSLTPTKKYRLPREERMKGYKDVTLINYDYPFDQFPTGVTPVAVEVRQNSEQLPYFIHPENPLYVFGPEDGSIPKVYLQHCHRFVVIPIAHCANLAASVYMVLYDRLCKQMMSGEVPPRPMTEILAEQRGLVGGGKIDVEDLVYENTEE
jgi:tRNA(Leu) C34 or U34 (ribose-2'-O)-methylase TrmL